MARVIMTANMIAAAAAVDFSLSVTSSVVWVSIEPRALINMDLLSTLAAKAMDFHLRT